MKQVLQDARSGEITVQDVPAPQLLPGCVLVRVTASVVSAGTERASSEFASKNLLQKAKARPDLVMEVLGKVRRDGLVAAVRAVRSRLDQPAALGYSSAGTVIGVGEGISDIAVGDRVACAGANHAVHAEFTCVPRLLVAKIPDAAPVSFEEAAFTTLGAVALHGIRVADAKLGDVVAVIGLGLLGQLTVQVLRAAGCVVLGMDLAADRADLALRLGAAGVCTSGDTLHELCLQHTHGAGADAILITAETPSSDPVNLAGRIARDRAVVVAVGTVGMEIERKAYYEKELDFRVSRSYGPGRYDVAYEQKGRDYPIGHVRWTETRNMEAFLRLLADGKLNVQPLITHRYPIDRVKSAYDMINGRTGERFLGVLYTYSPETQPNQRLEVAPGSLAEPSAAASRRVSIGLLGAGSFATGVLLPAIQKIDGIDMVGVCTASGSHSRQAADKFQFRYCTTDENQLFEDASVNTVVVSTRHHLHARQVLAGLGAGKHVFCEKPLCLREEELADIVRLHSRRQQDGTSPLLMIGFNRRFAAMAVRMKAFVAELNAPLVMHYRVNAGSLPADHWTRDPEQGGGRILGEVCHFVDFLSFLASAPPVEVRAQSVPDHAGSDNVLVTLTFSDGSHGAISYVASGDKAYSKERIEVFGGGAVATIDDFRRLELARHGRRQTVRAWWIQDKGHRAEWAAFAASIRGEQPVPIPFTEIVATTLATLRIEESRVTGHPLPVDATAFVSQALGFQPAGE